jgi:hypothetical protein
MCIFLIKKIGAATIRATKHIINVSYNQRQRFFHLSPEPRMLSVEKVRALNTGRRSGSPHMYRVFRNSVNYFIQF